MTYEEALGKIISNMDDIIDILRMQTKHIEILTDRVKKLEEDRELINNN